MSPLIQRLLQRKFLTMLVQQVIGITLMLLATWKPERAEEFRAAAEGWEKVAYAIIDLIVFLVGAYVASKSATDWIKVEGAIDAKRVDADAVKTAAAVENASPAVAKSVVTESLDNPK